MACPEPCCAAICNVNRALPVLNPAPLLLPACPAAVVTFRHQFQYKVKQENMDKVPEIAARWTWWAANAPADGKPTLAQVGKNLGIEASCMLGVGRPTHRSTSLLAW